jgi:hypothetical protein
MDERELNEARAVTVMLQRRLADAKHGQVQFTKVDMLAILSVIPLIGEHLEQVETELDDWRQAARIAADDPCPDEQHCTCVPALRADNARLRKALDTPAGSTSNSAEAAVDLYYRQTKGGNEGIGRAVYTMNDGGQVIVLAPEFVEEHDFDPETD